MNIRFLLFLFFALTPAFLWPSHRMGNAGRVPLVSKMSYKQLRPEFKKYIQEEEVEKAEELIVDRYEGTPHKFYEKEKNRLYDKLLPLTSPLSFWYQNHWGPWRKKFSYGALRTVVGFGMLGGAYGLWRSTQEISLPSMVFLGSISLKGVHFISTGLCKLYHNRTPSVTAQRTGNYASQVGLTDESGILTSKMLY